MAEHPATPDGRYFVVHGRLWRMADPSLPTDERQALVKQLMSARRAVRSALASADEAAEADAHAAVDHANRALGERGPVWWTDGAPDFKSPLGAQYALRCLVRGADRRPWVVIVRA